MNWDKVYITFASPWFFALMVLIPLGIYWYIRRRKKLTPSILLPAADILHRIPKTFRQQTLWLPFVLRMIAVFLVILALSRPQGNLGVSFERTESIDIMLCVDVSESMLAKDFDSNRLDEARRTSVAFVKGRPRDRFGLVIFGGGSLTKCPITIDHNAIQAQIESMRAGAIPGGTAIGSGLASAVSRLRDSEAKSKVVVLLTDGKNNAGKITPELAGEMARTYGVRVYSIGVGSRGRALTPVDIQGDQYIYDWRNVDIDETKLTAISDMTGGKYFRAENGEKLATIYHEIDRLEKTIIENKTNTSKRDLFYYLLWPAGCLIALEVLLRVLVYKQIP